MKMSLWMLKDTCWGVAKWPKAPDFDSGIRRFESFHPSHSFFRSHFPLFYLGLLYPLGCVTANQVGDG